MINTSSQLYEGTRKPEWDYMVLDLALNRHNISRNGCTEMLVDTEGVTWGGKDRDEEAETEGVAKEQMIWETGRHIERSKDQEPTEVDRDGH